MANIGEHLSLTRQQRLASISQSQWDIVIIGGGITGAGILKLACKLGLKALLLEQHDFAWGSSSRSSKMVHGGLRYIAQGQIKLTQESVHERQQLLMQAPGLVNKQSFAMSHYKNQYPWPWLFNSLLTVYDWFGSEKQHKYWHKGNFDFLVPFSQNQHSQGGTQFTDALTDDARLVLRLMQESQQLSGQAINYVKVNELLKEGDRIVGVVAQASEQDSAINVNSKIVINATGAWAKKLISKTDGVHIRPLRGSHLIVANWRLPVASAISVLHPKDKRPVQIFPWQNVTVIGTTDVEHRQSLNKEPHISQAELDYLLDAVVQQFPNLAITAKDIISTFAGIRPVVTKKAVAESEKIPPSKESREHSIWQQPGLITVAGGKLTTFRVIAQQVLQKSAEALNLSQQTLNSLEQTIFEQSEHLDKNGLSKAMITRLQGCYGTLTASVITQVDAKQLTPISYSNHLWAELIWAVKYEQVMHLDDLLLRRTRIGNVLPNGGQTVMAKIKTICCQYLAWDEDKWQQELLQYQQLWAMNYSLPSMRQPNTQEENIQKSNVQAASS